MIDYYSIPYQNIEEAQSVIDGLSVLAVDGPFQIPNDESGVWYFNVRSDVGLSGDWIGTQPKTPARVWA